MLSIVVVDLQYGAATAASKNSWHLWAMCSNYEISAKSNYNFEKTFLHLARKLAGHEAEHAVAASQPLPDDDDDAFDYCSWL
ncbi:hypothetical protein CsSME_00003874 [Camellia sinensis var. sinensis]